MESHDTTRAVEWAAQPGTVPDVTTAPVRDRRTGRRRVVGASGRVSGQPAPRSWAQGFDRPLF